MTYAILPELPGLGRQLGLRSLLRSRATVVGLLAMVSVDLGFLAVHAAHVLAEWRGEVLPGQAIFSVETEGGPSEVYESVKAMCCVIALAVCAWRAAAPVYTALAAAFAFALADNMLGLHEAWGEALAPGLAGAARLFESAPQALGELSFFLLAAVAILATLRSGFRRSRGVHRRLGAAFLLLLVALGAFAVGLDLLHAALGGGRRAVDRLFGAAEDGRELVVLSLAASLSTGLLSMLPRAGRRAGLPARPIG
jgi:hypothetical protein